MSNVHSRRDSAAARAIRKYSVSGFVLVSFAAYALHERVGGAAGDPSAPTPLALLTNPTTPPTVAQIAAATAQATRPAAPTAVPTAPAAQQPATAAPEPPAAVGARYRDGDYTGPIADAYYGEVQVKVTIQSGKLADVQFVEWPNDRRTSIRINRVAMPDLISEAIQAQSANVDVISGATLTSEAFAASLQAALDGAKT
jgi:uncharacterized protein with FMN-binding domain